MWSGQKPKGKTANQSEADVSSHSSFLPLTLDTTHKLLHRSFKTLEDRRVSTEEKLLDFCVFMETDAHTFWGHKKASAQKNLGKKKSFKVVLSLLSFCFLPQEEPFMWLLCWWP